MYQYVYNTDKNIYAFFKDGVPKTFEYEYIAHSLFGIYCFLAVTGVVFAVACLIFNLVLRKKM